MSQPQSFQDKFITIYEKISKPYVFTQICISAFWFIYLLLVSPNGKISSEITYVLNQFWVKPIASKIETNGISNIVFISFAVFGLIYLLYKFYHRYIFSVKIETFIYFLLLDLLLLRVMDSPWELARFSSEWKFTYIDFFSLTLLVLLVFKASTKKKDKTGDDKSELLSDDYCEDDSLIFDERKHAAENLSETLFRIESKGAYAIGIVSEWGNGKTTFIRYLEKQLKNKSPKPIVIRFEPWYCKGSDEIIQHFYKTLSTALGKYHGGIESKLNDYAHALLSKSKNGILSTALQLIVKPAGGKNIGKQFTTLNKVISDLNRKIFIEIDDLDRLLPDEIMECFRIVRNTASFKNVVYLLSYDKQYVKRAIRKHLKGNFEHYIEKIVQVEYRLPELEKSQLIKFIKDRLKDLNVSKDEIAKLFSAKYAETKWHNESRYPNKLLSLPLEDYFKNVRDCIRIYNTYFLSKKELGENATDAKLFMVSMLKVLYPDEALQIYLNFDKCFNTVGNTLLKDLNYKNNLGRQISNNYSGSSKLVEEKYKIEEFNRSEAFLQLVRAIFHPTENSLNSITNYRNYEIYFNGFVSPKFIKKNEIEEWILSEEKLLAKVRELKSSKNEDDNKKLSHLKHILAYTDLNNNNKLTCFYALIELVDINPGDFEIPKELLQVYDFELMTMIVKNPLSIPLKKIGLIINHQMIVLTRNVDEYSCLHLLSKELLKKTIQEKSDDLFEIYTYTYIEKEDGNTKVDKEVNKWMQEFANKHPKEFLSNYKNSRNEGAYQIDTWNPIYSLIFSEKEKDFSAFGEYLNELKNKYQKENWYQKVMKEWKLFEENDFKYIKKEKIR